MELRAMLTFDREALEELIETKAKQGAFVVTGDIEWEDGVATAMVRPMSPMEKAEHDIDDRPMDEVVYAQLQVIMDQVVDMIRDEHDQTREAADTSVMEWLEPFRTSINQIEAIVSKPSKMNEVARRAWGKADLDLEGDGEVFELTGDEEEEENLDEHERKRRSRFKRLRAEMEAEEDIADDRVRIKGESDEFPADKRVT